jgi:small subunit ribosomal protein S16
MSVKIRLARGGSKKSPYYRLVVANSRSPRDGDFIEKIGTYNPMVSKENNERCTVNVERANHWLNTGAQVTERAFYLLSQKGVSFPAHIANQFATKKENRVERPKKSQK